MRLIDADKFGEDLMKLWDYSCDEGVSAIAVLKQALLALNNAPTVDVDRFDVTTDDVAHWCATHPDPELKKQYEEELSRAKKLINAPTVEPRIEYGTDGQPYKLSMTNGKEYERPKGEWIVSGLDYQCSNCGMVPCFRRDNFCPNCGADMRKGGAE